MDPIQIAREVVQSNLNFGKKDDEMILFSYEANPTPSSMSLADRDQCLISVEKDIREKKNSLIEKRRHLKKVMNQNRFLTEVMGDYDKYYQAIISQKRDQMRALDMLNNYIQGLIQTEKLTEQNLKDAKKEQKKILGEVKKIKTELDHLLS
jgi:hypothetical protein